MRNENKTSNIAVQMEVSEMKKLEKLIISDHPRSNGLLLKDRVTSVYQIFKCQEVRLTQLITTSK